MFCIVRVLVLRATSSESELQVARSSSDAARRTRSAPPIAVERSTQRSATRRTTVWNLKEKAQQAVVTPALCPSEQCTPDANRAQFKLEHSHPLHWCHPVISVVIVYSYLFINYYFTNTLAHIEILSLESQFL